MTCLTYQYSNHAITQMFQRSILPNEVEEAIRNGEKINDYPYDKPYPGCLILYFVNNRPVHVVVSQDVATGTCFIITAYQPDPVIWNSDFKTKI